MAGRKNKDLNVVKTVKITPDTDEELKLKLDLEDTSFSEFIRTAINNFLNPTDISIISRIIRPKKA